ncbi:MAG: glucose 1-dehydrogenase [Kordiimonadaceae bacterium]|nr:glucose 1-dehydrogenase [Kordiimonadaceae bacterium]
MTIFSLEGRTAVVTGSSRGIGFSIAQRLAEHGANVVISSRREEACINAVQKINDVVGRNAAVAIRADIGNRDDVFQLMGKSKEALGDISIVVCNAASSPHFGPFSEIEDDQFRKTLENNILANHWLVQAALPHMDEAKSGSIILISSISALKAYDSMGAYSVSKAAELQLTRSYAQELAPRNIRVNAICPGVIETDFSKGPLSVPKIRKQYEDDTLLNRIGRPDELSGAAVFFASEASSYVTGQYLAVDGGAIIS